MVHDQDPWRRVLTGGLFVVVLAGVVSGLSGCARLHHTKSAAVVAERTETLPKTLVHHLLHPRNITYHIGPGDVLGVNVYLHPQLSVPNARFANGPPGVVVSNNGRVELPLLGVVPVAGLTVSALQKKLTHDYARYLVAPHVSVQVQEARSIRYYLLGEFTNPGLKYSDRPLHLLEAMALGGSVNLKDADLRGAYVVQGHSKLPINFYRLVLNGDLKQNAQLMTGDTIVIPDTATMEAFVFGAVHKPGAVPFVNGQLFLLQALADAGMDVASMTDAQLSRIHIIRSHGAHGQFIVVNAERILHGKAMPFALQSGDIVYVPQTGISHFNQIIQQILPSLEVVSGILNPFVQIKFLRQ